MSVARQLSTFRRGLLHRVVVRHAIADEPIPSLRARLAGAPPEWSVAVVRGDVVVGGPLDADPPDPVASVQLSIDDPAVELLLDTAGALDVALDADVIEHTIGPAEQYIEVRLLTSDGAPSSGRTVTVQAARSASSRPTDEIAPGVYRTDLTQFTASWRRFSVRRDDQQLGPTRQLQTYRTNTTVTVVEP